MPDAAVRGCDVLLTAPAGHDCLLPWPNDAFTVADPGSATGRRLNISSTVDPANVDGVHVDTTAQNRADGFSPGSEIITYVPNLSIANSKIATSTNIGSSLAPGAPIVIFDTVTQQRVPYFAELDAQTSNAAEQLLLIHPADRAHRGPSLRGRAPASRRHVGQPHRRVGFDHAPRSRAVCTRRPAASTSSGSSGTTSAPCSAVRCRTRRGTSPSRASRASRRPPSRCTRSRTRGSPSTTSSPRRVRRATTTRRRTR